MKFSQFVPHTYLAVIRVGPRTSEFDVCYLHVSSDCFFIQYSTVHSEGSVSHKIHIELSLQTTHNSSAVKLNSVLAMFRTQVILFQAIAWLIVAPTTFSFVTVNQRSEVRTKSSTQVSAISSVDSVQEASRILSEWDTKFNPDVSGQKEQAITEDMTSLREVLEPSILLLSSTATDERNQDSTKGRCLLGICASSAEEGVATLKAWVTALNLPRGLLHGMDKDGVPIDLSGGVYIKYNSGGVYTFSDIRKSGLGFDALWKPGDALLEPYDGTYRGVYFQVELEDDEFRQYLVPLDVF